MAKVYIKDVTGRRVPLSTVNKTLKNETLAFNDMLYRLKNTHGIKSFEASEESLREISEYTGIRYGILEGYIHTDLEDKPAKIFVKCKSNGQHYLEVRRQGAGLNRPSSSSRYSSVERDDYIYEVLVNLVQGLPPFSYQPERGVFSKDNYDLKLVPVVDAFETINIVISAPVTVRSGSMATNNGCELLKRLEKLPMATRTLVAGVIEEPKTAEKVTVTPFMHSMTKEAEIPTVVLDRATGKPYFVEIEDTESDVITSTKQFRIKKLTPFESILNLKFESVRILNTETNKPYDLRTKLPVSASRT